MWVDKTRIAEMSSGTLNQGDSEREVTVTTTLAKSEGG